jgi:hypothetical protein
MSRLYYAVNLGEWGGAFDNPTLYNPRDVSGTRFLGVTRLTSQYLLVIYLGAASDKGVHTLRPQSVSCSSFAGQM